MRTEGMIQKLNNIVQYINDNFQYLFVDIDGTLLNTHVAAFVYKDLLGIQTYQDCVNVCSYIPNVDKDRLQTFLKYCCWQYPEPYVVHVLRHVNIPIIIKTNRRMECIPEDLDEKVQRLTDKKIEGLVVQPNISMFTNDCCLMDDFPMYSPRDIDICVVREWSHVHENNDHNLMPLIA